MEIDKIVAVLTDSNFGGNWPSFEPALKSVKASDQRERDKQANEAIAYLPKGSRGDRT